MVRFDRCGPLCSSLYWQRPVADAPNPDATPPCEERTCYGPDLVVYYGNGTALQDNNLIALAGTGGGLVSADFATVTLAGDVLVVMSQP